MLIVADVDGIEDAIEGILIFIKIKTGKNIEDFNISKKSWKINLY